MEMIRKAHIKKISYGCDDCSYLNGKRCKLWEIKVNDPHNSHCESHNIK